MKKRIMSAAILLCLFLTLVSCGKGDVYLELAAFGESFRAENREMFPNDACEHYVRYRDVGFAGCGRLRLSLCLLYLGLL